MDPRSLSGTSHGHAESGGLGERVVIGGVIVRKETR